MSLSSPAVSRRLLRAATVLFAALPVVAVTAGTGGTALAPVAGTHTASSTTTASPSWLATAFVRSQRVAAPGAGVRAFAPVASRTYARSIDTTSKAAVNSAYWSMFASGLDVPTGWTGSLSGCLRGATSSSSRSATLSAVNFVRRLGGLAPVRFSSRLNGHAQAAALIMAANDQLSHYPPSTWRCYTRTGASTAARSNLALAYPDITSAGLVEMYMDDLGSSNYGVGHRRWVMNPFTTYMGTGSTGTANALQVVGPTSRTRPNPAYVSWPTRGWFPDALEPHGRWSLSAGSSRASFRYATVHVYRGTHRLTVRKLRVENGYARPTVVWQMPRSFPRRGSYRVVVTGIRHSGTSKRFRTGYTVRFFTPSR